MPREIDLWCFLQYTCHFGGEITMKNKLSLLISLSVILVLALATQGTAIRSTAAPLQATAPAATTHLKIGYSTWVGYGPLFIARDKGYFAANGLDVELVKVADPKERFTALAGSQLDGLVSTLDTMSQYWKAETPIEAIFGLDESSGGDGIVA